MFSATLRAAKESRCSSNGTIGYTLSGWWSFKYAVANIAAAQFRR